MRRREAGPSRRVDDGRVTTQHAPWLRPLGVGERIDAGIKLYRRNFKVLLAAFGVVGVPIAIAYGGLQWWLSDTIANAQPAIVRNVDGTTTLHWSSIDALYGKLAITYFVGFVLTVAAKAIFYRAFTDSYLSEGTTIRGAITGGLSKLGSVLWITLLIEGTLAIAVALYLAMIVGLSPLGPGAIAPATVTGCVLFAFFFWWSIANRFAVASMMMEDVRGSQALRRSMALVRGSWWSVFGTLVLVELIVLLLGIAFGVAFRAIASAFYPTTNVGPHAFVDALLSQAGSLLVLAPFTAAVVTVLCVDMRVRKEGLDLELAGGPLGGDVAIAAVSASGTAHDAVAQQSPWPPPPAQPTTPPSPWPPAPPA